MKNELRESDKRSKYLPFGHYFINSYNLFSYIRVLLYPQPSIEALATTSTTLLSCCMVISLEFDQQTFSQHCIMLISFDNNRDNRFVFIFLVSKVSQFCFCLSKLALSSRIIKRLFSGCVTR